LKSTLTAAARLRWSFAEMDNPQEHTDFLLETLWVMFAYGP